MSANQEPGAATGVNPQVEPVAFEQVLSAELEQIARRRQEGEAPPTVPDGTPHERAHKMEMTGLALSGGGIRSASFCLGILQGLSGRGLLRHFDYLSTVSGGGYIGSWLTAWIKREGSLETVEKQLRPYRVQQAQGRPAPSQPVEQEPQPIFHLRTYSNYLAPKLGLFSPDFWVLVAIYIRNFLLNQSVLLPAVLAALLVPRLGILFYSWHGGKHAELATSVIGGVTLVAVIVGLAFLLAGVTRLRIAAGSNTTASPPRQTGLSTLQFGIVLPLIVASFIVCWLAAVLAPPSPEQPEAVAVSGPTKSLLVENPIKRNLRRMFLPQQPVLDGQKKEAESNAATAPKQGTFLSKLAEGLQNLIRDLGVDKDQQPNLWMTLMFAIPGTALFLVLHSIFAFIIALDRLRKVKDGKQGLGSHPAWWVVCGTLSGFAGTALLGILLQAPQNQFEQLQQLCSSKSPQEGQQLALALQAFEAATMLTLGPPLALCVFVLGAMLQVGLMGRYLDNAEREWWGSVCGFVLRSALYWFAFCALALFGVPFLLWAGGVVQGLAGAAWVTTALGGVLAGYSPSTSGKQSGVGDTLLRVAPYVFIGGLLVVLSWGLSAGLDQRNSLVFWGSQDVRQNSLNQYWSGLLNVDGRAEPLLPLLKKNSMVLGLFAVVAMLASWCVGVNTFSLQSVYGDRLIRCYLGASRPLLPGDPEAAYGATANCGPPPRRPNPITQIDSNDDLPLTRLQIAAPPQPTDHLEKLPGDQRPYRGPYHLINTALNLVHAAELAYQERKAEAFLLSPLYCGCKSTGYRPSKDYAGGISLGDAMSISGAAASPNMGYHSSPAVTALLAIFDVRLGAWLGNPRFSTWTRHEPGLSLILLYKELFGQTNADNGYVYLSDGGHFENLGIYELVRRRCRVIIACDADQDGDYAFADLGGAIRKCRIDLGVPIEIDVSPIKPQQPAGRSKCHAVVGLIHYEAIEPQAAPGLLVYLKTSLTGNEPADVLNYATDHPQFPHEPTLDQFFTESQLESYRALGQHIAEQLLTGAEVCVGGESKADDPVFLRTARALFADLLQRWGLAPTAASKDLPAAEKPG